MHPSMPAPLDLDAQITALLAAVEREDIDAAQVLLAQLATVAPDPSCFTPEQTARMSGVLRALLTVGVKLLVSMEGPPPSPDVTTEDLPE